MMGKETVLYIYSSYIEIETAAEKSIELLYVAFESCLTLKEAHLSAAPETLWQCVECLESIK